MIKLEQKLKDIAANQASQPAIMAHVVLGYPTLEESIELVLRMEDAGVAIVELQIPFTDPMADGPVIMEANEVALANGVRTRDCMKAMERLAAKSSLPLLFMSYYNLAFCYEKGGLEGFCRDASAAGAQGLIIPDIPPEESADGYWDYCSRYKLAPIPLVSPISSVSRLKKIKEKAVGGFVYCVSTLGTTGMKAEFDSETVKYLERIKLEFDLPLAVGFGITSPEQSDALKGVAEIAIIGSATIRQIKKAEIKERITSAIEFLSGFNRQ